MRPRRPPCHLGISDGTVTQVLDGVAEGDTLITYAQWSSGGTWVRFSPYLETDSPNPDPIDGQVGLDEWYGNWVIIDPVR